MRSLKFYFLTATAPVASDGHSKFFEEFCQDRKSVEALRVTAYELMALSRASLLGELTSKDDVLFMLNQIRGKD
ncbi:MAG: hypothetical protein WBY93_00050 [Candidatus Binatus sp.]